MSNKHTKHPPLGKRPYGAYHTTEWAIYGSTCSRINDLAGHIAAHLPHHSIIYVDADHSKEEFGQVEQINKKQFHHWNPSNVNSYDDKIKCQTADVVLVNGNHYPASRQIVLLDENKKDSLFRRLDQLHQIDVLIKAHDDQEIYDFLEEKITANTKIITEAQEELFFQFLRDKITEVTPPLDGMVLAGGKSSRMGEDKSQMIYHEQSQELHLANLLASFNIPTYISKGANFTDASISAFPVITDRILNFGPLGAILSAFMQFPRTAKLAVACDIPLLNKSLLNRLIEYRNPSKVATAVKLADNPFPEPLITIYEPRAYERLLSFIPLGYSCPRKMLINSDVAILEITEKDLIRNANDQAERKTILKLLGK